MTNTARTVILVSAALGDRIGGTEMAELDPALALRITGAPGVQDWLTKVGYAAGDPDELVYVVDADAEDAEFQPAVYDEDGEIVSGHETLVVQLPAGVAYTVAIQAWSTAGRAWQALEPAETHVFDGSAQELADWAAGNQTVVDKADDTVGAWRVAVWDGAGADTGTEPAAVWESSAA